MRSQNSQVKGREGLDLGRWRCLRPGLSRANPGSAVHAREARDDHPSCVRLHRRIAKTCMDMLSRSSDPHHQTNPRRTGA